MKVAWQELPGKVKLTEETRGRLNGVYHRRFAKSANSTSSIPTKKPTAEKSSQNTGRCFSNGMVPVKNRFSRPSRDSLIAGSTCRAILNRACRRFFSKTQSETACSLGFAGGA